MGAHVLTVARSAAKPADCGELSQDSASCARDTDPQDADVLDRIRRVSRLLAKMRRDNFPHTGSGGQTVWKPVTQSGKFWRGSDPRGRAGRPIDLLASCFKARKDGNALGNQP